MTAIGILGGTFDPPHFGHLRIALELCEGLGLAEVRLLPCFHPPHRPPPIANARQRLAMLVRATATVPQLTVDRRELDRKGTSYMVDTLHSLRDEFKDRPLCLIMGMDAFSELDTWHRWQKLATMCHIIVATRPPDDMLERFGMVRIDSFYKLSDRPAGYVLPWTVTQLAISATAIRRLIAERKSPRFLLPDEVLEFINSNGLYGEA